MRTPILVALIVSGCAHVSAPRFDAHQHLFSPAAAALNSDPLRPRVTLPPELATVFEARLQAQQDRAALGKLYETDASFLQSFGPEWILNRDAIADWWVEHTDERYGLEPVGFSLHGSTAFIDAYLTDLKTGHPDAHLTLALTRTAEGRWLILSESLTMGGPHRRAPITADRLIALLDAAQIPDAVVLSVAYQFASAREETADEQAKVAAENDWTAAQVAHYPARLIAFCSVNPLKSYALAELERCAKSGHFRGLKLHLGNSRVDFTAPGDVQKVRAIFAAANSHRLPLVVHLAPREGQGRSVGEVVLEQLLPAAPDITVQLAHFGSPGHLDPKSDEALGVLIEALQQHDPRAKNLWFDLTTLVENDTSAEMASLVARRIRQIGPGRVLFGSDGATTDARAPRQAWAAFKNLTPLSPGEFETIAGNVPPYAK